MMSESWVRWTQVSSQESRIQKPVKELHIREKSRRPVPLMILSSGFSWLLSWSSWGLRRWWGFLCISLIRISSPLYLFCSQFSSLTWLWPDSLCDFLLLFGFVSCLSLFPFFFGLTQIKILFSVCLILFLSWWWWWWFSTLLNSLLYFPWLFSSFSSDFSLKFSFESIQVFSVPLLLLLLLLISSSHHLKLFHDARSRRRKKKGDFVDDGSNNTEFAAADDDGDSHHISSYNLFQC